MAEFENVFIYVSDALRYDHVPGSVAEEGNVVPTLTAASYTPISFTSIVTGKHPSNHSVRSFYDRIESETVMERFEDSCYYDHPDDTMCVNVFQDFPTSRELDEMEPPFFYIERALDTHEPYAEVKHGNEIVDRGIQGSNEERYMEGVESTEQHFWSHVEKLKELGLYEDTLVVFTSDHGELLGERKLFRERHGHNKPVCRELNVVPTVFVNHENSYSHMRSIDLAPTTAALTGKNFEADGVNLENETPGRGESMVQLNLRPPLIAKNSWRFKNGEWRPGLSRFKTDIATLISDYTDPWKKRLKNTKAWNRLTTDREEEELVEEIEI